MKKRFFFTSVLFISASIHGVFAFPGSSSLRNFQQDIESPQALADDFSRFLARESLKGGTVPSPQTNWANWEKAHKSWKQSCGQEAQPDLTPLQSLCAMTTAAKGVDPWSGRASHKRLREDMREKAFSLLTSDWVSSREAKLDEQKQLTEELIWMGRSLPHNALGDRIDELKKNYNKPTTTKEKEHYQLSAMFILAAGGATLSNTEWYAKDVPADQLKFVQDYVDGLTVQAVQKVLKTLKDDDPYTAEDALRAMLGDDHINDVNPLALDEFHVIYAVTTTHEKTKNLTPMARFMAALMLSNDAALRSLHDRILSVYCRESGNELRATDDILSASNKTILESRYLSGELSQRDRKVRKSLGGRNYTIVDLPADPSRALPGWLQTDFNNFYGNLDPQAFMDSYDYNIHLGGELKVSAFQEDYGRDDFWYSASLFDLKNIGVDTTDPTKSNRFSHGRSCSYHRELFEKFGYDRSPKIIDTHVYGDDRQAIIAEEAAMARKPNHLYRPWNLTPLLKKQYETAFAKDPKQRTPEESDIIAFVESGLSPETSVGYRYYFHSDYGWYFIDSSDKRGGVPNAPEPNKYHAFFGRVKVGKTLLAKASEEINRYTKWGGFWKESNPVSWNLKGVTFADLCWQKFLERKVAEHLDHTTGLVVDEIRTTRRVIDTTGLGTTDIQGMESTIVDNYESEQQFYQTVCAESQKYEQQQAALLEKLQEGGILFVNQIDDTVQVPLGAFTENPLRLRAVVHNPRLDDEIKDEQGKTKYERYKEKVVKKMHYPNEYENGYRIFDRGTQITHFFMPHFDPKNPTKSLEFIQSFNSGIANFSSNSTKTLRHIQQTNAPHAPRPLTVTSSLSDSYPCIVDVIDGETRYTIDLVDATNLIDTDNTTTINPRFSIDPQGNIRADVYFSKVGIGISQAFFTFPLTQQQKEKSQALLRNLTNGEGVTINGRAITVELPHDVSRLAKNRAPVAKAPVFNLSDFSQASSYKVKSSGAPLKITVPKTDKLTEEGLTVTGTLPKGDDVRIAVVGRYNAGKTTTIFDIMGLEEKPSDVGDTTHTEGLVLYNGEIVSKPVTFIDTMGADSGRVQQQTTDVNNNDVRRVQVAATKGLAQQADLTLRLVDKLDASGMRTLAEVDDPASTIVVHVLREQKSLETTRTYEGRLRQFFRRMETSVGKGFAETFSIGDVNFYRTPSGMTHVVLWNNDIPGAKDHNATVLNFLRYAIANTKTKPRTGEDLVTSLCQGIVENAFILPQHAAVSWKILGDKHLPTVQELGGKIDTPVVRTPHPDSFSLWTSALSIVPTQSEDSPPSQPAEIVKVNLRMPLPFSDKIIPETLEVNTDGVLQERQECRISYQLPKTTGTTLHNLPEDHRAKILPNGNIEYSFVCTFDTKGLMNGVEDVSPKIENGELILSGKAMKNDLNTTPAANVTKPEPKPAAAVSLDDTL